MSEESYRDQSREEWAPHGRPLGERDDVNAGSLQRIADALENILAAIEKIEARTERLENEIDKAIAEQNGGDHAQP